MYTDFFVRAAIKVLLLVLLMVSSGWSALTGTILLKSGERFESVAYSIDQKFRLVEYKIEGREAVTNFENIEAIYDATGHDISADVLSGRYSESELEARQSWLGQRKDSFGQARPKPWHAAVRVGGNFTKPSGYYYSGTSSGIGYGADIILPLNGVFSLRGIVSLAGTKVDEQALFGGDGYSVLESNLSFNVWRYLATVQYQRPYGAGRFDKGHWFVYSGFGATSHTSSGLAVVQELATSDLYEYAAPGFRETFFTMTLGAGSVNMFSKWGGIEYGGSFDFLFVRPESYGEGAAVTQHALNYDLHLGVVLVFPTHANDDTQ